MNANIQVEITDDAELHCFRLLLNPQGHEPCCPAAMSADAQCSCSAKGAGQRLEIMFHARSLVDLIHKCSLALCDWQKINTDYLLARLVVKKPDRELLAQLVCRECGRVFGHETP